MGVHRKPGPLVHQENLVVLIDNGELRGGYGEIGVVLPGLVEEFIVDIQLEHIACRQPGVPLYPGAVALDAFDADIFLGQGGGQQGNGLGQEPIQALARVVGSDGQFLHCPFPMLVAKCRSICSVNSRAAL